MKSNLLTIAFVVFLPVSLRAADEKVKLSTEEEKIIELVNKARAEEKLPPLKANKRLMEAAQKHSANMARQEKMEHTLDDKTPADRIKAESYLYAKCGENIAAGEAWKIEAVHDAWMKSEGHRANILDKDYTEIGVGLAKSAKGEMYYTQVFGKPQQR